MKKRAGTKAVADVVKPTAYAPAPVLVLLVIAAAEIAATIGHPFFPSRALEVHVFGIQLIWKAAAILAVLLAAWLNQEADVVGDGIPSHLGTVVFLQVLPVSRIGVPV